MNNRKLGWIKRKENGLGTPWNKGLTFKKDRNKLTGKYFNCLVCGKSFYRYPSFIKGGHYKYCSYVCSGKARIGTENFHNIDKGHTVIYKCQECNKEKKVSLSEYKQAKNHFCSMKCAGVYQGKTKSGYNHWNWKGGISGEDKLLRQTPEYNQWRLLVYKRDYYTCQECGNKHINIVAHHIKSFSEFEDLRFGVDNGITLCRSCHKKVHKETGLTTQFA